LTTKTSCEPHPIESGRDAPVDVQVSCLQSSFAI